MGRISARAMLPLPDLYGHSVKVERADPPHLPLWIVEHHLAFHTLHRFRECIEVVETLRSHEFHAEMSFAENA